MQQCCLIDSVLYKLAHSFILKYNAITDTFEVISKAVHVSTTSKETY